MISYCPKDRLFLYTPSKGITLICFTMRDLQHQMLTIYGVNALTFLN